MSDSTQRKTIPVLSSEEALSLREPCLILKVGTDSPLYGDKPNRFLLHRVQGHLFGIICQVFDESIVCDLKAWVSPDQDGLSGIVIAVESSMGDARNVMENPMLAGILSGFGVVSVQDVGFCEPYRPYAWPHPSFKFQHPATGG
jgi:hypothetical protein